MTSPSAEHLHWALKREQDCSDHVPFQNFVKTFGLSNQESESATALFSAVIRSDDIRRCSTSALDHGNVIVQLPSVASKMEMLKQRRQARTDTKLI